MKRRKNSAGPEPTLYNPGTAFAGQILRVGSVLGPHYLEAGQRCVLLDLLLLT